MNKTVEALAAAKCDEAMSEMDRLADGVSTWVDREVISDRRGVGAEAIFFATIEQRLMDAKTLVAAGVIVAGICVQAWPHTSNGKAKEFLGHYNAPASVKGLLQWLYGGDEEDSLSSWLAFVGSDITACQVLRRIGMPSAPGKTIPMTQVRTTKPQKQNRVA